MKHQSSLQWLIPLIFGLAVFAAGAGLFWPGEGQPYPLTTFRGEQVIINARGLYYWDTVSTVAQMQANDLITLILGLPLLGLSTWLAFRGSLRGQLLLSGTLGFFLYTYASMCFGTAYNQLFLVYVALFSLSLVAFILSLLAYDLKTLPQHFAESLPRRGIAALFILVSVFLSLAWLGRIVPTLLQGQIPALENTTSLFIQALDLGLIVPLCILAAILLLRRSACGYLLASVAVMKMLTMGTAVSTMGINMMLNGVSESWTLVSVFIVITVLNFGAVVVLLRSISASVPVRPIHTLSKAH